MLDTLVYKGLVWLVQVDKLSADVLARVLPEGVKL